MKNTANKDIVRLDKWLWAARFFKQRNLAVSAINAGHVQLNAQRSKPAKKVNIADIISVQKGNFAIEVEVLALCDIRRNATLAQMLYRETKASAQARAMRQKARRQLNQPSPTPEGKPNKRERQQLLKLKNKAPKL